MKKRIILGVTGSIAAYKAADLTSMLVKEGYRIDVVMSRGGQAFITPLTLQTLSQNRVYTDVFQEDDPEEVKHIALARKADMLLVAPASADVIAKLAGGIADDMLTATALAVPQGVFRLIAPAMNTQMYENPITLENLRKLEQYGYRIIQPKSSRLACGDVGRGALADVEDIAAAVRALLSGGCPKENTTQQESGSPQEG